LNLLTVLIDDANPIIHFDVTTVDDFTTIFIRILRFILRGLFEGTLAAALETVTPLVS
jgi:hypothetical protein